jgi:hypothetical protein
VRVCKVDHYEDASAWLCLAAHVCCLGVSVGVCLSVCAYVARVCIGSAIPVSSIVIMFMISLNLFGYDGFDRFFTHIRILQSVLSLKLVRLLKLEPAIAHRFSQYNAAN